MPCALALAVAVAQTTNTMHILRLMGDSPLEQTGYFSGVMATQKGSMPLYLVEPKSMLTIFRDNPDGSHRRPPCGLHKNRRMGTAHH
jgi:hypothetical protein